MKEGVLMLRDQGGTLLPRMAGTDIAGMRAKLKALITAGGIDGEGPKAKRYVEGMILTTHGRDMRRRF
jgi:hypothetical protein